MAYFTCGQKIPLPDFFRTALYQCHKGYRLLHVDVHQMSETMDSALDYFPIYLLRFDCVETIGYYLDGIHELEDLSLENLDEWLKSFRTQQR